MKVTLWGTRGSLASPGPDTTRYGGNTSCIEVHGEDGASLILDAGSGIRRLGMTMSGSPRRVDLLLTHLHMDHILGLGFFAPLRKAEFEVHIWGPASTTQSLWARLSRYMSPPLFPVHLRDLPCRLHLHEVPCGDVEIGEFVVSTSLISHPGPAVGYRIATPTSSLAYLPDHEPALGVPNFPLSKEWTSGYSLAAGVDLLIHDAQYNDEEYEERVGFGHSSLRHAIQFAELAQAKQLMPFHHDPAHDDNYLDRLISSIVAEMKPSFSVIPGIEGATLDLG